MRIIRDTFGDVQRDGQTIHTSVRIMVDDQHRTAVFEAKTAPVAVYDDGEVTYTSQRKPCACKGDPPRMTLMRLWDAAERQAARAS